MRILFVVPEYPPDFGGGIVTYYDALLPALRELGCEVRVLRGSAFVHGGDHYCRNGVAVSAVSTALVRKWSATFRHFQMFPELRRHLAASFALHEHAAEREAFDAVEVTDWGMLFIPWVSCEHKNVLVQMHGSSGQILKQEPVRGRDAEAALTLLIELTALAMAPKLSTYSRGNQKWWECVAGRPVEYLPPPLDLNFPTDRRPATDRWLAVGRIQAWKGPQVAAAAWACLGKEAPLLEWCGRDTTLGASGESTAQWLRSMFPETWDKTIVTLGQIPPHEVKRRLQAAKAVLVPSTWDVFNLAAAEAMAMGKVVVVSDGAGAADLVEPGVNGFMFPSGDAKALADVVRLIERMSESELVTIGNAAATSVRERLNPRRVAEAKLLSYRSPMSTPARDTTWFNQTLLPSISADSFQFLDNLPLKGLSLYVARRTAQKVAQVLHRP